MDDIVDKIRKLLALTQSPNAHEAALAAERARALMEKHQIEVVDLGQEETRADKVELKQVGFDWALLLGGAVAKAFFCKCFRYDRSRKLILVGRPTDAASAAMLMEWLCREVKRLCERDGRFQPKQWKDAFYIGAAQAIHDRLQQRAASRALVRYGEESDNLIVQWAKDQGLVMRDEKIGIRSHAGYEAGEKAGYEAELDAPEKRFK